MRRNTFLFIFGLLGLSVFAAFFRLVWLPRYQKNQLAQLSAFASPSPVISPESTAQKELNQKIAEYVSRLSPEQKVGQLLAVPVTLDKSNLTATPSALTTLQKFQPGAITLFGRNVSTDSASRVISQLHRTAPNLLVMVDHEGGSVQRLSGAGFTKLPDWAAVCPSELSVQEALFTTTASELKSVGVNVVLGPVIDITSTSSALQNRGCSDATQIFNTTQNYLKIFSAAHILSVLKHYPGIGQSDKDLHQTFDQQQRDPVQIKLFEKLLQSPNYVGVMTSHLGNSADPAGIPCSLDKSCISELQKMNPTAIIFSDALEMSSATHSAITSAQEIPKSLPEISSEAISAGNTILVFGPTINDEQLTSITTQLLKGYNDSATFRLMINQAVEKVIRQKYSLGVLQL